MDTITINGREVLTVEQAAAAIGGCKVRSVQNWCKAGLLNSVMIAGARMIFADEIQSFARPRRGNPRNLAS